MNTQILKDLIKETKRVRAEAIAQLRALDSDVLAAMEPAVDRWGYNSIVKKVHHYPSDLTLPRLVRLVDAANSLSDPFEDQAG